MEFKVIVGVEHEIVPEGVAVVVGVGFTTTVDDEVPVQPLRLPKTVYTVVTVGLAITVALFVTFKPVAGLHV